MDAKTRSVGRCPSWGVVARSVLLRIPRSVCVSRLAVGRAPATEAPPFPAHAQPLPRPPRALCAQAQKGLVAAQSGPGAEPVPGSVRWVPCSAFRDYKFQDTEA